jgi:PadR family transcriptional regulator, regulatory protein AphA
VSSAVWSPTISPKRTILFGLLSSEINLTPTSFIVLGLVARQRQVTPYELKQIVAASIGNFWSVPHSQLYAEPDRLAAAGYLAREQEEDGLRRKRYSLTDRGCAALGEWLSAPAPELPELRDESLLKVFFDADPGSLAAARRDAHRAKLEEYERRAELDDGSGPRGPWRALAAGVGHEREWIRFWSELARE